MKATQLHRFFQTLFSAPSKPQAWLKFVAQNRIRVTTFACDPATGKPELVTYDASLLSNRNIIYTYHATIHSEQMTPAHFSLEITRLKHGADEVDYLEVDRIVREELESEIARSIPARNVCQTKRRKVPLLQTASLLSAV